MSTQVSVNTYTYSIAYLTNKMLVSLHRIISWSGLDPSKFAGNWSSTERAIKTWLNSKDLTGIVLEVFDSTTNKLITRWDISVEYDYSVGSEGAMWVDTDTIRYAIAKAGVIAATCDYRVLIISKPGRPDVEGWSPATFRSTDGLMQHAVGTTIGTNNLGGSTSYWARKL